MAKANRGPYSTPSILSIFREIISASRALEAPMKVSYLGPSATFTHLAAVSHFGSSADMIPSLGIQQIFDAVEKRHSDYGVVPIENSTEGVVSHTLDLFAESPLKVCAEVVLRVTHHLLSVEGSLKNIKVVYSHPHALAQCRRFLATRLTGVKLKEIESTAEAAKLASGKPGTAAIASEIASSCYKLPILQKEIQDESQNFTRFLVIGNHISGRTGNDKTSILFTINDEVGGLYKILAPFSKVGVNLTKIESRPLKKKVWAYMFFVDLDGHQQEGRVARAIREVQKKCLLFKVLGSYPKNSILT